MPRHPGSPHPLGLTIHLAYPSLVPPPADTDPPFDDLDRYQANAEGWDLWECVGTTGSPYQIQGFDYPDELRDFDLDSLSTPDDPEMAALIVARALAGSPLHIRTMHHLYWANQEEWRWAIAMYRWEPGQGPSHEYLLPPEVDAWLAEAHIPEED